MNTPNIKVFKFISNEVNYSLDAFLDILSIIE